MAIKIERQIKEMRNIREITKYAAQLNSRWLRRGGTKQIEEKNDKQLATYLTSNPKAPDIRQSIVKCFKCLGIGHITSQCPSQYAMIIQDDEDVVSDH